MNFLYIMTGLGSLILSIFLIFSVVDDITASKDTSFVSTEQICNWEDSTRYDSIIFTIKDNKICSSLIECKCAGKDHRSYNNYCFSISDNSTKALNKTDMIRYLCTDYGLFSIRYKILEDTTIINSITHRRGSRSIVYN